MCWDSACRREIVKVYNPRPIRVPQDANTDNIKVGTVKLPSSIHLLLCALSIAYLPTQLTHMSIDRDMHSHSIDRLPVQPGRLYRLRMCTHSVSRDLLALQAEYTDDILTIIIQRNPVSFPSTCHAAWYESPA